ncbi:MAG: cysteine dioxygenase [Solirubrobacteraceae bacterium]
MSASALATGVPSLAGLLPAPGDSGPERLRGTAAAIAARPVHWAHLVRHDPDERGYALLHSDADVTVWLLFWSPGHDTGFHDHDTSSAAVAVASGALRDERLAVHGDPIVRGLQAGDVVTIEPSEIHRMHHAGGEPTVSVHVYSPPLRRTGAYAVADDGRLLRHAQAGEDALEPATA